MMMGKMKNANLVIIHGLFYYLILKYFSNACHNSTKNDCIDCLLS